MLATCMQIFGSSRILDIDYGTYTKWRGEFHVTGTFGFTYLIWHSSLLQYISCEGRINRIVYCLEVYCRD